MKTLIAILIACLISIIPLKADMDVGTKLWLSAGPSIFINSKGKGISSELCLTNEIFNLGGNIQYQDGISPKYNFYIGLGFMNLIQFQYGTDFFEKKLRIQSICNLGSNWYENIICPWYKKFNIHIFYEKNYTYNSLSNIGFGIHYLIL